jgi:hypothetical protein
MARRPVSPPKPKTPVLTVGQKRRRIERLQKCVTKLEAFDPNKARKRAPVVLELEAAIDKALSSAFGYGTPAYLRYNEAATLDPSPLLTKAPVQAAISRPADVPARHDVKVQETRPQVSENKARAIALLQNAIRTLEEEIASAKPVVAPPQETRPSPPVTASDQPLEAPPKVQVRAPSPRAWNAIGEALRRRVGRWWPRGSR